MAEGTVLHTMSGATLAISASLPATYNAAGYGATGMTYTTVGEIENFGNHGVTANVTTFTAIAVTHVSTVRPQMVNAASKLCVSRVQVTVMAATYQTQKSVLALVRAALPRSRGTVNGVAVDSILIDIEGPDFTDEAGLYMGSIDYRVTYTE